METSLCEACRRNGRVWCPHNAMRRIVERMKGSLKEEMFGSAPSIFVGHSFYPNVYWGPLVSAGESADDPSALYGLSVERILELRAQVIRGMRRGKATTICARPKTPPLLPGKGSNRLLEEAQEAAMSIKPVDAEVKFSRQPFFSFELDSVAHPIGASAPIEKFRLAENPSVPATVDAVTSEGLGAREALSKLLLEGFDVHYISRLLSAGLLGEPKNRKLVPTKWAITATDDMAAKRLLEPIRDFKEIQCPRLYSNSYLDNHFQVLLLPGKWEYEQFEVLLAQDATRGVQAKISHEYEPHWGRADYAERQGGGYYAARFAVCEALYKMRRQARAAVFRKIGAGYDVPVGVWEVRENVRHAMMKKPLEFNSTREAIVECGRRLAIPLVQYAAKSRILFQQRLGEFE